MEYLGGSGAGRDRIVAVLLAAGVDVAEAALMPDAGGGAQPTLAVIGKAGSGKTMLLADLVRGLIAAGVEPVSTDYESRKSRTKRTLAVLAPTNKAASVLRGRGVPATTIHRILYTPLYHPDYEAIAEWLTGKGERPKVEGLTETALDRAMAFYRQHRLDPGALASAGLRGSDFIKGWKRRDEPLDIGLIDEASMLDERQYADLGSCSAPWCCSATRRSWRRSAAAAAWCSTTWGTEAKLELHRVHRQAADSPILDLAHALGDPELGFGDFEAHGRGGGAARRAGGDQRAGRCECHGAGAGAGLAQRHAGAADPCVPARLRCAAGCALAGRALDLRRHRAAAEAPAAADGSGGARADQGGAGDLPRAGARPGFARLFVIGAEDPQVGVASIIQIETPGQEEPIIVSAASMGAVFLHGAAVTIHKAQGSQWPEVQVFAPDLYAAAQSGRQEAGLSLWKRLAYVAVTRTEERLVWVTRYALARPKAPLGVADLANEAVPLALEPAD